MKKKAKNGVNSGNTMRLGSLKQYARYNNKNKHCILKSVKNRERFGVDANQKVIDQAQRIVDDGGLHAEVAHNIGAWDLRHSEYSVEYTLNKRKRWLLPAMIKDCVHHLKSCNEIDRETDGSNPAVKSENQTKTHMSLAERKLCHVDNNYYRYWRQMNNSCVGYYDSTNHIANVIPKHKYSYETDLREKGKCKEAEKYSKSKRAKRAMQRRLQHNQHLRGVQRNLTETKKVKKSQTQGNPAVPQWILEAHNPDQARASGAAEEDVLAENEPRIHYEVCYPGKLSGSKMLYDTSHIHKFEYIIGCHKKAMKKTKHFYSDLRRTERCTIKDGLDIYNGERYMDSLPYNDILEEVSSTDISYDFCNQPTRHFSLEEALRKTKQPQDSQKNQKRKKSKKNMKYRNQGSGCPSHPNTAMSEVGMIIHPKGSAIFMENSSDASSQMSESSYEEIAMESVTESDSVSQSMYSLRSKVEPVSVSLSREEITVEALWSSFHHAHQECETIPRIFILNLSAPLSVQLNKCVSDMVESVKPLFLIFEESKDKGSDPSAKQFRLHVDGELGIDGLQEIQNWLSLRVADISNVQNCASLVSDWTFGNEHIRNQLMNRQRERTCGKSVGPSLIQELQRCETSTYTTEAAYNMLGINNQCLEAKVEGFEVVPDKLGFQGYLRTLSQVHHHEYCDICYDSLVTFDDDGMDSISKLDGLSLASCQHWFCRTCWQQHLFERIRLGDTKIKCPAFECDGPVSTGMCLALLPHNLYQTHLRHIGDHRVESDSLWKWCPNHKCGRAARLLAPTGADDSVQANVTCSCGTSWCFACQQEAHWPSTCRQATAYFRMVKQKGAGTGEITNNLFFVQVKKCPFCRHPIEKDGGCQHMTCTKCMGHFCWECLGAWSDHGFSLTCPKARASETTMEIDFERDVMLDQVFTDKALELRRRRKSFNLVWKLSAVIAFRVRKLQYRVDNPESRITYQRYWHLLAEKACDGFIQDAWNFMHESMYLMEHTYVILSKSSRRTRRRGLLETFQRLEFVVNALYQMLVTNSKQPPVTLEEKLAAYVHHGKSSAQDLVHKLALLPQDNANTPMKTQGV